MSYEEKPKSLPLDARLIRLGVISAHCSTFDGRDLTEAEARHLMRIAIRELEAEDRTYIPISPKLLTEVEYRIN